MANSSSEDETDTLPERPTRIQPYQFEPARQDFERVPVFLGSPRYTNGRDAAPHCGSIARELVHCYTWGRLRIATVRGNTVGRHS